MHSARQTPREPNTSAIRVRNIRVADPRARISRPPRRVKRPDPLRDGIATVPILLLPVVLLWAVMVAGSAGPTLAVSPQTAAPGAQVTVEAQGFERGESGV